MERNPFIQAACSGTQVHSPHSARCSLPLGVRRQRSATLWQSERKTRCSRCSPKKITRGGTQPTQPDHPTIRMVALDPPKNSIAVFWPSKPRRKKQATLSHSSRSHFHAHPFDSRLATPHRLWGAEPPEPPPPGGVSGGGLFVPKTEPHRASRPPKNSLKPASE